VRSRSILAVLATAIVGVACGVGAGLALDRTSGPHQDPLGLNAPFVNQDCSGETLLSVEVGPNRSALAPAFANDPSNVSYLDTSQSCPTAWSDTGTTPQYVAYLGPMPANTACGLRLSVAYRGDRVIRLSRDATTPVQCLCYHDYQTMPVLHPGVSPTLLDGIYVNSLQNLLTAMHRRPDIDSTGQYDPLTQTEIRAFQEDRQLPTTGVVDSQTWKALVGQGCRFYTS
jgi:peptidoglycan hydrolase-like protein with peptidoglycan-binding domain